MCRQRQQKTKTLLQEIAGLRIVPNLLPDEDKVSIMEWLLQRNNRELRQIYSDSDTPAFVAKCIDLLAKRPLTVYVELMQSFIDGDKEIDKKDPRPVGLEAKRAAV